MVLKNILYNVICIDDFSNSRYQGNVLCSFNTLNGKISIKGLKDLRFGPIDNNKKCKTCKKDIDNCPGHFGYIKLEKPVYHVGFFDQIIKVLKCVCWNCHRLLINDYDIR